jgi:hypothetical protein
MLARLCSRVAVTRAASPIIASLTSSAFELRHDAVLLPDFDVMVVWQLLRGLDGSVIIWAVESDRPNDLSIHAKKINPVVNHPSSARPPSRIVHLNRAFLMGPLRRKSVGHNALKGAARHRWRRAATGAAIDGPAARDAELTNSQGIELGLRNFSTMMKGE